VCRTTMWGEWSHPRGFPYNRCLHPKVQQLIPASLAMEVSGHMLQAMGAALCRMPWMRVCVRLCARLCCWCVSEAIGARLLVTVLWAIDACSNLALRSVTHLGSRTPCWRSIAVLSPVADQVLFDMGAYRGKYVWYSCLSGRDRARL